MLRAPAGVAQDVIGHVQQPHDAIGFLAVRVAIGMIFLAKRLVRGPDYFLGRVAGYLEVVVMGMHQAGKTQ
ncbi:hypothetical protein D3C86_1637990 [compost metagenome]